MEKKKIKIANSLQQMQEFGIEEYDDHITLGAFLSRDCGIENVEIPEKVNGKEVTNIGEGCFFNYADIKSVTLPQTIETIGAQAFALCEGLTELILPDSITQIGNYAFRDCRGLKKVILPKKLKHLSRGLFAFCYLDNPEIILPDWLETIGNDAFWNAGDFNLVIPDSVKKIGVGAFYFGPRPITKLPDDKGWYMYWPYGEIVICEGTQGRITDIHQLENDCSLHEVTLESEIRQFVYPCDYLDGCVSFTEEKNRQGLQDDIKHYWDSEEKRKEAYQVKNAWKRGLIVPE